LPASCYRFSGESVRHVYNIKDFYSAKENRYMLIDEMYDFLEQSSQWTLLGKAYDQKALEEGQQYANEGKAVVAIMRGKEYGHMAVLLPGELQPSGSWMLRVPNSASFFTHHQVDKSYVGKKLSYAFTPADQGHVLIYTRKY